jgi:hypothetical protein
VEYAWGDTKAWLKPGSWTTPAIARTCADALAPLSVDNMKALDECLDVAPSPDFIFEVTLLDGGLAIAPREQCARGVARPADQALCDTSGPFYVCAQKVARIAPRSASPCWRELDFVTLTPL